MGTAMAKRRVIVESPYAGDVERNVAYARAAMRDCLCRGEAPLASHLLYTQDGVLCDDVPAERQLGIEAGLAWGQVADATVVYADFGISHGMHKGIERARAEGRAVEFRSIDYDVAPSIPWTEGPCFECCAMTNACVVIDGRRICVACACREAGEGAKR